MPRERIGRLDKTDEGFLARIVMSAVVFPRTGDREMPLGYVFRCGALLPGENVGKCCIKCGDVGLGFNDVSRHDDKSVTTHR